MARNAPDDQSQKPKIAKFSVDSSLLEELGERLVAAPEVALTELIKNSYDADANQCTLILKEISIAIEDRGFKFEVQRLT
jgi:hypothetical protein